MNAMQLRWLDFDSSADEKAGSGGNLRVLPSVRSDRAGATVLGIPALATTDAQTPVDKSQRESASSQIEPAAVLGLRQALNSDSGTNSVRLGAIEILAQTYPSCQVHFSPSNTYLPRQERNGEINKIRALSRPDNVVRDGISRQKHVVMPGMSSTVDTCISRERGRSIAREVFA